MKYETALRHLVEALLVELRATEGANGVAVMTYELEAIRLGIVLKAPPVTTTRSSVCGRSFTRVGKRMACIREPNHEGECGNGIL